MVAQQKAFSLLGEEKEAVQQECARLRDEVKQKLSELTVIRDGAADNNLEIGNIQGQLAGVEKDLALKGAQIKSLLGNKDELLKEIESRGREIHVLERDSTQKLGSLTEQFRLREGLIDDLEQKLEQLENEFVVKRKEWQEQLAAVKADSEREISQQVTAFQQELNGKGESWNIQQQQLRQELESEIALRDGQLAGRQVEVDGLREELTNKELQWQRRMAEEEQQAAEKINELAAAGENFRQESERKSAEWTGEQESLRQELAQLRSLSEQSQSEGQRLANELRQREQFIQTIKEEAERQENIYRTELAGKDEQLTALARRMQEMEADGARVREERESLNGQLNNAQQELDQFRSLLEQKKLAEQRLAEEVEQRVQELETNSAKLREERDGFAGQLNNSRQELVQLQARHDESLNNIRGLEGELVQREQFMQNLEKESQQKEEHYRQEISNKERQLEDSYRQAAELQDQINSLNGSIQELRDARSRLEEEKTNLGDELSGARREMEQSLHEKGNLLHDVERERESFQEQKAQWEQELEELRGNWEHVVEENRALQKQSYQEKQKLIREYTETINKQARLEKRSQLEREVNDRIRVKSELERLSSFLQDNLSSLQRGTKEIETSMEQLQSEIDNKNLSLKHISEADKRDAKKNTFSFKAEPVDNTTPEVLSE